MENSVEELRIRYRNEALVAVKAAEERGIQKGRDEISREFEILKKEFEELKQTSFATSDELKRWKMIAMAAGGSDKNEIDTPKNKELPLLQFIMDKVYQQIKKEFEPSNNAEFILSFKKILLNTTKDIMKQLPEMKISVKTGLSDNKMSAPPSSPSLSSTATQQKNKGMINEVTTFRRRVFKPLPPWNNLYFVRIRIVETKQCQENSTFLGSYLPSTFVAYLVESELFVLDSTSSSSSSSHLSVSPTQYKSVARYSQLRRHKEFQQLCLELKRLFPFCTVPPLPTSTRNNTSDSAVIPDHDPDYDCDDFESGKIPSAQSINREAVNNNKENISVSVDSKVYTRRRRLALWLQLITMNPFLVAHSSHLSKFLTDLDSPIIPKNENIPVNAVENNNIEFQFGEDVSVSWWNGLISTYASKSGRTHIKIDLNDSSALQSCAKLYLNKGVSNFSDSRCQMILNTLKLSLDRITNDIDRINPAILSLQSKTQSFHNSTSASGYALLDASAGLNGLVFLEKRFFNNKEADIWQKLQTSLRAASKNTLQVSSIIHYGLYEPLYFFGKSCLSSITTCVSECQQAIKITEGSMPLPQQVKATQLLVNEWEALKQTRARSIISYFKVAAFELSSKHKALANGWKNLVDIIEAEPISKHQKKQLFGSEMKSVKEQEKSVVWNSLFSELLSFTSSNYIQLSDPDEKMSSHYLNTLLEPSWKQQYGSEEWGGDDSCYWDATEPLSQENSSANSNSKGSALHQHECSDWLREEEKEKEIKHRKDTKLNETKKSNIVDPLLSRLDDPPTPKASPNNNQSHKSNQTNNSVNNNEHNSTFLQSATNFGSKLSNLMSTGRSVNKKEKVIPPPPEIFDDKNNGKNYFYDSGNEDDDNKDENDEDENDEDEDDENLLFFKPQSNQPARVSESNRASESKNTKSVLSKFGSVLGEGAKRGVGLFSSDKKEIKEKDINNNNKDKDKDDNGSESDDSNNNNFFSMLTGKSKTVQVNNTTKKTNNKNSGTIQFASDEEHEDLNVEDKVIQDSSDSDEENENQQSNKSSKGNNKTIRKMLGKVLHGSPLSEEENEDDVEEEDTPMNRAYKKSLQRVASAHAKDLKGNNEFGVESRQQQRLNRAKPKPQSHPNNANNSNNGNESYRRPIFTQQQMNANANININVTAHEEDFFQNLHQRKEEEKETKPKKETNDGKSSTNKNNKNNGNDDGWKMPPRRHESDKHSSSTTSQSQFNDSKNVQKDSFFATRTAHSQQTQQTRQTHVHNDHTNNQQNHQTHHNNNTTNTTNNKNNQNSGVSENENLPPGWQTERTTEGRIYYFHSHYRVSRWDKPTLEEAALWEEKWKKEENEKKEKKQKEKREVENVSDVDKEKIKMECRPVIEAWCKMKRFPELLSTAHTLVPLLSAPHSPVSNNSPPAMVKKEYLKIARVIHPDKLSSSCPAETKVIAEEVFIVLSEAYDFYRKAHSI